jgi:hypothetical protein
LTRGDKPKEKMKTVKTIKTCCGLIGAATLLAAPNLFATVYTGTITLERAYGNSNGGGAFTAVTSGLGTFDTFCLASQVEFTDGQTYNYVSSDSAIPGGPGNGGGPDPISIGTAWLYSQFAHNVTGFYGTSSIAIGIQNAIWWLEDEAFGVKNSFVTDAELALGLNDTTIKENANGAYGVIALDLTTANGCPAQPQLAIVPEASTVIAGALLLLPMGISALRIVRKNRVA